MFCRPAALSSLFSAVRGVLGCPHANVWPISRLPSPVPSFRPFSAPSARTASTSSRRQTRTSAVAGGEFEPQLDPQFAAQQLTVLGLTLSAGAYWWCASLPHVCAVPRTFHSPTVQHPSAACLNQPVRPLQVRRRPL